MLEHKYASVHRETDGKLIYTGYCRSGVDGTCLCVSHPFSWQREIDEEELARTQHLYAGEI